MAKLLSHCLGFYPVEGIIIDDIIQCSTAADCIVDVALEALEAMLNGSLNPMTAFMSGKIKVNGDMSVAMKLPQIMG